MKLFEITKINRDRSTGKRLGFVMAFTKKRAAMFMIRRKKIPEVRVFNTKQMKNKNPNKMFKFKYWVVK